MQKCGILHQREELQYLIQDHLLRNEQPGVCVCVCVCVCVLQCTSCYEYLLQCVYIYTPTPRWWLGAPPTFLRSAGRRRMTKGG